MASVWLHSAGAKQPDKIAGRLDPKQAVEKMNAWRRAWRAQGKNRHTRQFCGLEFLLFDGGKLAGSIFVELLSPPSIPDRGEHRRTLKA